MMLHILCKLYITNINLRATIASNIFTYSGSMYTINNMIGCVISGIYIYIYILQVHINQEDFISHIQLYSLITFFFSKRVNLEKIVQTHTTGRGRYFRMAVTLGGSLL